MKKDINLLILSACLLIMPYVKPVHFVFYNNSNLTIKSITFPNNPGYGNANQPLKTITLDQNYPVTSTYKSTPSVSTAGTMPLMPGKNIVSPDSWPINSNASPDNSLDYIFVDSNGCQYNFKVTSLYGASWSEGDSSATLSGNSNNLTLNIYSKEPFYAVNVTCPQIANCSKQLGATCTSCNSGYNLNNNNCTVIPVSTTQTSQITTSQSSTSTTVEDVINNCKSITQTNTFCPNIIASLTELKQISPSAATAVANSALPAIKTIIEIINKLTNIQQINKQIGNTNIDVDNKLNAILTAKDLGTAASLAQQYLPAATASLQALQLAQSSATPTITIAQPISTATQTTPQTTTAKPSTVTNTTAGDIISSAIDSIASAIGGVFKNTTQQPTPTPQTAVITDIKAPTLPTEVAQETKPVIEEPVLDTKTHPLDTVSTKLDTLATNLLSPPSEQAKNETITLAKQVSKIVASLAAVTDPETRQLVANVTDKVKEVVKQTNVDPVVNNITAQLQEVAKLTQKPVEVKNLVQAVTKADFGNKKDSAKVIQQIQEVIPKITKADVKQAPSPTKQLTEQIKKVTKEVIKLPAKTTTKDLSKQLKALAVKSKEIAKKQAVAKAQAVKNKKK